MDPDVSVHPLPVLLVSLCESQRMGNISGVGAGAETPRSSVLQGYPLSHWHECKQGGKRLLLPTLLLLFLGLGICLLLLYPALTLHPSNNRKFDLLGLLRGKEEEEGLLENNISPWTQITPTGISTSVASISFHWEVSTVPTPGLGTSSSLPTSSPTIVQDLSPAPSSAPPPVGKCSQAPPLVYTFILIVQSHAIGPFDFFPSTSSLKWLQRTRLGTSAMQQKRGKGRGKIKACKPKRKIQSRVHARCLFFRRDIPHCFSPSLFAVCLQLVSMEP